MAIDLGELQRLTFTLTSPGGGLVNADTVSLNITLPDGSITTITPVDPTSTGLYQYDYLTVQSGRHLVRWVATGTNPGAHTDAFDVFDSQPSYLLSLADVKAQLNLTTTAEDEELQTFIESATAVIEDYIDKVLIQRTITEEHYLTDYSWGFGQNYGQPAAWGIPARKLALRKRPALTLVSVDRFDGTLSWDVTNNLHLNPSGIVDVLFGNPLSGHVRVVYTAGMSVIPARYTLAAAIIVQHLWQTQRGLKGSPKTSSLAEPHGYGASYLGFAIPQRALELLGSGGKLGFA